MDEDPQLDQLDQGAPPAPSPADDTPEPATDETRRYSLYDTGHRRFIGRVLDKRPTKADVAAASKARGGRKITVREV